MPARALMPLALLLINCMAFAAPSDYIRPYAENPAYWQYKGAPVLLLGGSKDDNLFQIPDLEAHLDEIAAVGGDYIRNTMSARQDHGYEIYPYAQQSDSLYNLDIFNEDYWQRFERLLAACEARDIIVQIELWDRFDYSQEHWAASPWRPSNNVNYAVGEVGLEDVYRQDAWRDRQPFFHTIPGMPLYEPRLDRVRGYQERLVRRMLDISLRYPNVLYCMDNETSTPVAWGMHWMAFIQEQARKAGVEVWVTDMFDDGYDPANSGKVRHALAHPERYGYIDLSQVNSRVFGEEHWRRFSWLIAQLADAPRPVNHVKIYSDGETSWGSGTPKDGVERFWRNLIAGAAACRFHRPGAGIGLNDAAKACIRAARLIEARIPLWTVKARPDLLSDREENAAYLAARPGEAYVLYFPGEGAVTLDLSEAPGDYVVTWIDVAKGELGPDQPRIRGGAPLPIACRMPGDWVAAIVRAE